MSTQAGRVPPHASAQLLRDSGITDADRLAAVEDHHERNGGGGYPRGLAQVDELAHVLRAADRRALVRFRPCPVPPPPPRLWPPLRRRPGSSS